MTKVSAAAALEAVLDGIITTLKKGEEVRLVGFGAFSARESAEEKRRDLATREEIKLAPSRYARFKPGAALRASLNRKASRARLKNESAAPDAVQLSKHLETFASALDEAQKFGSALHFTIEVLPGGKPSVTAIEPIPEANSAPPENSMYERSSKRSFAAARERGRKLAAEILHGEDMLSGDAMARLLGTTRMTINTKRRNHQLLALEGAKRGFRFPQWQIGNDGKPFDALPALFDRLGGSPWAVYRFLVQHHAELGGLTGCEALAKGRSAQVVETAESVAKAFS